MGRSEQRELGPFRALKMRPVRQEAVHSLWSRLFCGTLKMRRVPQEAFLSTARIFRTVEACFWYRVLSHMRQVAAAAEPGEHFSRPPFCATGLDAVSINPLQALAVGFHAMVLNRASTLPINSAMPRSPFILSRSALRLLTLYLFNKHNRARIAKKRLPNPPQGKPAPATHPRLFHHNGKGTVNPKITICNNYFFRDGVYDEQKSD